MKNVIPFIEFSITDKCNFNCAYCVAGDKGINYASNETVNGFINFVKSLPYKPIIGITGGSHLLIKILLI